MKNYTMADNIELIEIEGDTDNFVDGYYIKASEYLESQIEIFNKENNQNFSIDNMFGISIDDDTDSDSIIAGDYLLVAKNIAPEPRLGQITYAVMENTNIIGTVVKVIRDQYTPDELEVMK